MDVKEEFESLEDQLQEPWEAEESWEVEEPWEVEESWEAEESWEELLKAMDLQDELESLEAQLKVSREVEEPWIPSWHNPEKELLKVLKASSADEDKGNSKNVKLKDQWKLLKKEIPFRIKHGITFEKERIRREMSIGLLKQKIKEKNTAMRKREVEIYDLHKFLESIHACNTNKERADNALRGLQEARKIQLELDAQNEVLIEEKKTLERELEKIEDVFSNYAYFKDVAFKVKAQVATTSKNGIKEENLSQSEVFNDNDPAFDLPTPEEFLTALTELKEENMSLLQNVSKVDHCLKELTQKNQCTSAEAKEDEDKITLQIHELRARVDDEKANAIKLKQRVCLFDTLETSDEHIMLKALDEKVSKIYRQCMNKQRHDLLSSVEMVANMESRLCTLLDQVEGIPKDFVKGILKIKETERRNRQMEEQLRREREKQLERQKKYLQRTYGESQRRLGRKLMPRSFLVKSQPVKEKDTKVCEVNETEAFLFGTEDDE